MKKSIRIYVTGFISAIVLLSLGGAVYAAARTQSITVTYNNIRLVVNGEAVTPRDAQGNEVEPFLYNGTTFLPVRALADALGQTVRWDGETATVYVGEATVAPPPAPVVVETPTAPPAPVIVEPTEVLLFNQQHVSVGNAGGLLVRGNEISNTIQLWGDHSDGAALGGEGWAWVTSNYIAYALNGTANRFMATLNPPGTRGRAELTYRIYGDGRLLYETHAMTTNVLPLDVDIDITDVDILRIEVVLVVRALSHPFEVLGRTSNHRGIENARILTYAG